MSDKSIGQLKLIIESIEKHYNDPVIAPNGKAEGLCLVIRGLKGILKSMEKEYCKCGCKPLKIGKREFNICLHCGMEIKEAK